MSKKFRIALYILRILFLIFVLSRPCLAETQQDTVELIFENAISVNDLSINTGDNNVITSIDHCIITIDQAYKADRRLHSSIKIDFNELAMFSLKEEKYPRGGYEIIIHGDTGSVEISGTDGEHGSYNTLVIAYNERQKKVDDAIKYFTSDICAGKH